MIAADEHAWDPIECRISCPQVMLPDGGIVSATPASLLECRRGVAFLAAAPEAALMNIVCGVTAMAGRIECNFRNNFFPVAGVALQALVCAGQGKARLPVMVKSPACPSIRVVALGAIRAEATGVVLVLVTDRAISRYVLESGRAVAFLARQRGVEANQGKPREVVIERDLLAPTALVVAPGTARAKLSFVRIILLVATDARSRQFVAIEFALMTRVALDLGMTAEQWELCRFGMVEVHRFPGLRRMTGLALGSKSAAMSILYRVT